MSTHPTILERAVAVVRRNPMALVMTLVWNLVLLGAAVVAGRSSEPAVAFWVLAFLLAVNAGLSLTYWRGPNDNRPSGA